MTVDAGNFVIGAAPFNVDWSPAKIGSNREVDDHCDEGGNGQSVEEESVLDGLHEAGAEDAEEDSARDCHEGEDPV